MCRELAEDGLQPISYTGEGPGGSLYCVNMQTIIRRKRLLVRSSLVRCLSLTKPCHGTPTIVPHLLPEHACDKLLVLSSSLFSCSVIQYKW